MKLEKGKISRLQLFFLVFCFILGSSMLVSIVVPLVKQNLWITIITGMLEAAVFVYFYVVLAHRFPGKTLIEIINSVYRPVIARFISFTYIVFLIMLIALNLRFISDLFSSTILENTPNVAIMIAIIFLCAYTVTKGLEVIARCSFSIIVFFLLEVIITFLLLIYKMDFTNFLPIMQVSAVDFLKSTNVMATIPFGEIFVFLMIIPYVNKNKKIFKPVYLALISAGIIILIIVVRNTAVLGNSAEIYSYPSYQANRLINIRDILTRIEVITAITALIAVFIKISVLYYALVLATAQVFNLKTYLPFVIPFGYIIVVLALINFEFYLQQVRFGINIAPLISLPVEIIFPLLTIVLAKIKKIGET